jgi:hypothetical protein
MELLLIFFLSGIIIVGALMFALINKLGKSGSKKIDLQYFRAKCLEIEHQLKRDEPNSYHVTVMNFDKLLDQALKAKTAKGSTMGERMKNSATLFSDRNGVWTAHKLRNTIAHEPDARVTYDQARQALYNFRKALKDLGVI